MKAARLDGKALYTNNTFTTLFTSDGKWFQDGFGNVFKLDINGFMEIYSACPTQTPTSTQTPTVTPTQTLTPTITPTLTATKLLEFNENVVKCYDWNGTQLNSYCSAVNIRQHFYKYYDTQIDTAISLEEYTIRYPCNTEGASLPGVKKVFVKPQRKYKVKSGDSLIRIANKYHTTVAKIKKANGLRSDMIRIGQVLKIP